MAGRGEQARRRIQDAALRVIAERGLARTALDHIVTESGMSRGGVYHHYDSVEAIILDRLSSERADAATLPADLGEFFARQREELLAIEETIRPLAYEFFVSLPVARRRPLLSAAFEEAVSLLLPLLRGELRDRDAVARHIVRAIEGLDVAAIAGVLTRDDLDRDLAALARIASGEWALAAPGHGPATAP